MKKFISLSFILISFCILMPVVSASNDNDIKQFIKQFTENINSGSLDALNQIESTNIKLTNNMTTYMDSMKIEQDVTKIKEKNGKYEVTTKATIDYSGSKNKTKLKYEITENEYAGLTIATTNLFDKIGHGSLISNVKFIIIFIVIAIIVGAILIYLKRKNDLKQLNHMRKHEKSTGLGGMMDHH